MAMLEQPPRTEAQAPIGFGRMARKEDARFIRGQGTYVDDVQLPGMLHGAILRSPYAHARIVSIDATAALQHPRVHAVITGRELAARGLAWRPATRPPPTTCSRAPTWSSSRRCASRARTRRRWRRAARSRHTTRSPRR